MAQERRDLQRYQQPEVPSLIGQVFTIKVQLTVAAKGASVEIKDIRPRVTQALIDELRERLKEGLEG